MKYNLICVDLAHISENSMQSLISWLCKAAASYKGTYIWMGLEQPVKPNWCLETKQKRLSGEPIAT